MTSPAPPPQSPHATVACRGLEVGIHHCGWGWLPSALCVCMYLSTFLCESLGSKSSRVIWSIKGLLSILCPRLTWCWLRTDFSPWKVLDSIHIKLSQSPSVSMDTNFQASTWRCCMRKLVDEVWVCVCVGGGGPVTPAPPQTIEIFVANTLN